MQQLMEKLDRLACPRLALMGDFMLDRYVYGDTERISPEAPVPVLRVTRKESRPGGAGSVAVNIQALGGQVECVGVIGGDDAGKELLDFLTASGAGTAHMVTLPDRQTILKQRMVGLAQGKHPQQMLRVDEEYVEPLGGPTQTALAAALRAAMGNCRLVALEDYGKGVFTDAATPGLISEVRSAGLGVLVDPAAIRDYRRYRGASVLIPNRAEAQFASGVKITDDASLQSCAEILLDAAAAEAVIIKLDKDGSYLARCDQPGVRIPTRQRAVYDTTGAGDAVLAMLGVALAEGCSLDDAVALANVAGGLEVERFGIVPVTRQEIADELRHMIGLRGGKVMDRHRLAQELARRRQRGERIVFTNGCFDLLHMGHVRYLQQARELGAALVVAINSDDSVRRLKGPSRPVCGQDERAEMLGALECVDYVTIFDEDTPIPLLELLRPELLVKGGATPVIVGRELVESYGGKAVNMELVEGLSTTQIINRIMNGGK
jgi:D-beta-D-heptose 7-phosphate kinase/D-beta-D-heptose 1-phosphate adenosyltransferase